MKIEIFGKQNCPFCEQAKALLNRKNIEYSYIDFFSLEVETQEQTQKRAPDARTFPMIFVDNIFIGGFREINSAIQ